MTKWECLLGPYLHWKRTEFNKKGRKPINRYSDHYNTDWCLSGDVDINSNKKGQPINITAWKKIKQRLLYSSLTFESRTFLLRQSDSFVFPFHFCSELGRKSKYFTQMWWKSVKKNQLRLIDYRILKEARHFCFFFLLSIQCFFAIASHRANFIAHKSYSFCYRRLTYLKC